MIRFIPFLVAFIFIVYKIYKLNQRILSAKAFIFINKINDGTDVYEANYLANLFDFFKKDEAKNIFIKMEKIVKEKYNNKKNDLIYRAQTWGFVNTHTRAMFKKKRVVTKNLEKLFLNQNPQVFSGNSKEASKEIIDTYWDIFALKLSNLDNRICILKLLLEKYKNSPEDIYKKIATDVATATAPDSKFLNQEDIDTIKEWDNLLKK